jgi:hypothetical protein
MAKKYSRLLLKSLDGADASVLAQYKQDAMIVPVETAADRGALLLTLHANARARARGGG